jgi:hypothetical protein
MPVSFREILDAFQFVSVGGGFGEHQAFLCRQTGKIFWRSELSDFDEFKDELPDDELSPNLGDGKGQAAAA